MRRHLLHIAVALFTFTASFLFAGTYNKLALAIPAALTAFTLVKIIPELNITLHHLKVGAITLVLWVAAAYFLVTNFLPTFDSCVVFSDTSESLIIDEGSIDNSASHGNELMGITAYSCDGAPYTLSTLNTIWAGIIDRKTIAKPAPIYPPLANSAAIKGRLAVSVVVDETGKVVWAQSLSGHPILRQSVMEAACRARFNPTLVDRPPVRVAGILTYRFDGK